MLMERKITAIKTEDKKVLIEMDGEYHLFLYTRDLRKAKWKDLIREDSVLDQDRYEELKEHVINRGKRRIMHLLAKQDYPISKLEQKLLKAGYIADHVSVILKPFSDRGLIDDSRLIGRRIESYKTNKSKMEIRYKLKQGGFSDEQVKEAIAGRFGENDELESAVRLLNKRFFLKKMKLEEPELRKRPSGI